MQTVVRFRVTAMQSCNTGCFLCSCGGALMTSLGTAPTAFANRFRYFNYKVAISQSSHHTNQRLCRPHNISNRKGLITSKYLINYN
jgi:hypothetical protein